MRQAAEPQDSRTQGRPCSSAGAPALVLRCCAAGLLALGLAGLALGCGREPADASDPAHDQEPPMNDGHPSVAELARVIAVHSEELLAIPGVEGMAVGLLDDGRTPCLQILVERRTSELAARLPATLDGHPVVLVESGDIRPLDGGR
jgi:hypothetical protein